MPNIVERTPTSGSSGVPAQRLASGLDVAPPAGVAPLEGREEAVVQPASLVQRRDQQQPLAAGQQRRALDHRLRDRGGHVRRGQRTIKQGR